MLEKTNERDREWDWGWVSEYHQRDEVKFKHKVEGKTAVEI